jgi:hypothetical protein
MSPYLQNNPMCKAVNDITLRALIFAGLLAVQVSV